MHVSKHTNVVSSLINQFTTVCTVLHFCSAKYSFSKAKNTFSTSIYNTEMDTKSICCYGYELQITLTWITTKTLAYGTVRLTRDIDTEHEFFCYQQQQQKHNNGIMVYSKFWCVCVCGTKSIWMKMCIDRLATSVQITGTVEPRYNEVLGTMKITLLY